jgi:hypothetical protein
LTGKRCPAARLKEVVAAAISRISHADRSRRALSGQNFQIAETCGIFWLGSHEFLAVDPN